MVHSNIIYSKSQNKFEDIHKLRKGLENIKINKDTKKVEDKPIDDALVFHFKDNHKNIYEALKENDPDIADASDLIAQRGTRPARYARKALSAVISKTINISLVKIPLIGKLLVLEHLGREHFLPEDQKKNNPSFFQAVGNGVKNFVLGGKKIFGHTILRDQRDESVNEARIKLAKKYKNTRFIANDGKEIGVDGILKKEQREALGFNKDNDAADNVISATTNIQDKEKRLLTIRAITEDTPLKKLLIEKAEKLEEFINCSPEKMKHILTAFKLKNFDGKNLVSKQAQNIDPSNKLQQLINQKDLDTLSKLVRFHQTNGGSLIGRTHMQAQRGREAMFGVAKTLADMKPTTKTLTAILGVAAFKSFKPSKN